MNLINKSRRRHLLSSSCQLMRRHIRQRAVDLEDIHHLDHQVERSISDVLCRPKQAEASLILEVAVRWVYMETADLVRIALHWPHLLMVTVKCPHSPARVKPLLEVIILLHPLRRIKRGKKRCHSTKTLPKQTQQRFTKWLVLMGKMLQVLQVVWTWREQPKTCSILNKDEIINHLPLILLLLKKRKWNNSLVNQLSHLHKSALVTPLGQVFSKLQWKISNKCHKRLSQPVHRSLETMLEVALDWQHKINTHLYSIQVDKINY